MTKFFRKTLVACVAVLLAFPAFAQSARTEHTLKLDDPESRPAATLDDVSWLVGSWQGEAFGGTFEQVWNAPSAGSMVGLFKLMEGDEVAFYEILLLIEEEGTLNFKVKHFSADFTAWEDKEDHINFRFVKAEENAVHFSGISFYKISDCEMHAWIVMRSGESLREEKLVYKRDQASN